MNSELDIVVAFIAIILGVVWIKITLDIYLNCKRKGGLKIK